MRAETIDDDLKALRSLLRLTDAPLSAQYEAYLEAARAAFGMRTASIGSYSNGVYKVLKLASSVPVPLTETMGRPLAEIFAEEVVRTHGVIACRHIGSDADLRRHALYSEGSFEAYIAAPVRVSGEMFGVLSLLDPEPRPLPFSSEDCEFLQLLADTLGHAIERDRLRREERAADRERRKMDLLFSTAFAEAPIGMVVVNLEGRYLQVNAAAASLFGYSEDILLTKHFRDISHPGDIDQLMAHMQELLLGKVRTFQTEKRYIRPDGTTIWTQLNVALVQFEDGSPRCFIGQIQDISLRRQLTDQLNERQHELEIANEKLQHLASVDALTGVLNRRALRNRLQEEMERATATGSTLGFVMVDVDLFKAYNDTHGHVEGDVALKVVAECLQNCCRASDVLGRFGGEEFLILLPDVTQEEAVEVAERARSAIEHSSRLRWPLTVSAGVHMYHSRGDAGDARPERPIARADEALYKAKQGGRNRVAVA